VCAVAVLINWVTSYIQCNDDNKTTAKCDTAAGERGWSKGHCTALHCTALHYTALHCTALHYTTLHYTTPIVIAGGKQKLYCPEGSRQCPLVLLVKVGSKGD